MDEEVGDNGDHDVNDDENLQVGEITKRVNVFEHANREVQDHIGEPTKVLNVVIDSSHVKKGKDLFHKRAK